MGFDVVVSFFLFWRWKIRSTFWGMVRFVCFFVFGLVLFFCLFGLGYFDFVLVLGCVFFLLFFFYLIFCLVSF